MKKMSPSLRLYIIAMAWFVAIFTAFAIVTVPIYSSISQIHHDYVTEVKNSDDFTISRSKEKAYMNVLMAGLDKGETRTDVIMIAQFNFTDNTIRFLQIPRDTYVEKAGDKKINSSYGAGGIEKTIKDIQSLVDIEIDRYIIINISGFRDVVDAVGGVYFDVPQRMKYSDPYQDLYIDLNPGYQHLDGNKAEQLVRFRQYPMGDLQRIEVQINFIKEAMKQITEKCKSGEADYTDMINSVMGMVETNFGTVEAGKYAPYLLKSNMDEIQSIRLEGEARYINNVSYFVADHEKNKKIIEEYFTPNNDEIDFGEIDIKDKVIGGSSSEYLIDGLDLGDGTIPAGTTVNILDYSGTNGEALARTKQLLESYGCEIPQTFIADASTVDKTICVTGTQDLTCAKIAKTLGANTYYYNEEYDYDASVVVILGKEN